MALATKAWAIVTGAGALMVVAAQTEPKQAISNLTAWARIIGLDKVQLPHALDTAVTVVGLAVSFIGAVLWWRTRRNRPEPITRTPEPTEKRSETYALAVVPGPSQMEQLLAKRELLASEIDLLERSTELCREAINHYGEGLSRFSSERVSRPTSEPLWPERALDRVVSAFTNTHLKGMDWLAGLKRPNPTLEQNLAPPETPGYLTSNREFFEPAHNERYLGLHRENLAYLEEAMDEVKVRAQELRNQLTEVRASIQSQARQING